MENADWADIEAAFADLRAIIVREYEQQRESIDELIKKILQDYEREETVKNATERFFEIPKDRRIRSQQKLTNYPNRNISRRFNQYRRTCR